MHLLSEILFAVSSSADNLTIGAAYGIKKIKIGWYSNLIIAGISCLGTILSMAAGHLLSVFISASAANVIGSIILMAIGFGVIVGFSTENENKQRENEKWAEKSIEKRKTTWERLGVSEGIYDRRDTISMGLSLAANNLSLGIGAGLTGVPIAITASCTLIGSLLFICFGQALGRTTCLARIFGKYAVLISGLLIIFLGIYEIFI